MAYIVMAYFQVVDCLNMLFTFLGYGVMPFLGKPSNVRKKNARLFKYRAPINTARL